MTTINLNNKVRVKLNDRGVKIHCDYWQPFSKAPEPKRDADGYTEYTLWEFMNLFGPRLHNGCTLPFENTEVEIVGDDKPTDLEQARAMHGSAITPAIDSVWNTAIEAAAKTVDASTMEYVGKTYQNAEDWIKVKAAANVRKLKR